jgi:hypothetical protein
MNTWIVNAFNSCLSDICFIFSLLLLLVFFSGTSCDLILYALHIGIVNRIKLIYDRSSAKLCCCVAPCLPPLSGTFFTIVKLLNTALSRLEYRSSGYFDLSSNDDLDRILAESESATGTNDTRTTVGLPKLSPTEGDMSVRNTTVKFEDGSEDESVNGHDSEVSNTFSRCKC